MIRANTGVEWLPLYEALASEVRLKILELLAINPMNVKEIAQSLELSSAIVTMHIRKLEQGGLISTQMIRKDKGTHKICTLAVEHIDINLPTVHEERKAYNEVSVPIGHYTEFEVHPTCGLATRERIIGQYDDPRYFHEPDRMYAKIVWLGRGFLEYKIPNYLLAGQIPEKIEISMELGSEAPGYSDQYPSDIQFYLNGAHLGQWTSPGDFGSTRGLHTPDWWGTGLNQYGLLKVIQVYEDYSMIDGQVISNVGLKDIVLERNHWTFRLAVEEGSQHVGGLTLYGEGFGNYKQDIVIRVYYRS
jgi:predicted transcriptional regulator